MNNYAIPFFLPQYLPQKQVAITGDQQPLFQSQPEAISEKNSAIIPHSSSINDPINHTIKEAYLHLKTLKTLKKSKKKHYKPRVRSIALKCYKHLNLPQIAKLDDCVQISEFAFPRNLYFTPGGFGSDSSAFRPFFNISMFKRIYRSIYEDSTE